MNLTFLSKSMCLLLGCCLAIPKYMIKALAGCVCVDILHLVADPDQFM